MARILLYTCVTGGYDAPEAPDNLPEDFGWLCLTPEDLPDGVRTRIRKDGAVISRYPKINPDRSLPEGWTHCVWMDGNIAVADSGFYDHIRSLADQRVPLALIPHPQRGDVFSEADKIIDNGRDSICNVLRARRFLRKEGLPENSGLYEANVIFRELGNPAVMRLDDLWWSSFSQLSRRDQLTLPYAVWKSGLHATQLLPDGQTARTSPLLRYTRHDPPYVKNFFKDARRAAIKAIYRILK